MESVRVYTYRNCETCRRANRFLKQAGLSFDEIPIRERPPNRAELMRALRAHTGVLRSLFNSSGRDFRELGLGARLPSLSEDEALDLLEKNGNLVKRPFLVTSRSAWAGFREEEWRRLLALNPG